MNHVQQQMELSRVNNLSRISNADGLRALAITGVILSHVFPFIRAHGQGYMMTTYWLGGLGVDCFFVLSGFLLSRPFFDSLLKGKALPSTSLFFKRRFFRIYPAYAVAVLLSAITFTGQPYVAGFLVSHLLFLHGFMPSEINFINGPLWTMAVDAQFYLFLPIFGYALTKLCANKSRPQRARAIGITLCSFVIFSVAWRAIALHFWPIPVAETGLETSLAFAILRNLLGVIGCFALGMLVTLAELEQVVPSRKRRAQLLVIAAGFLVCEITLYTSAFNETIFANAVYDTAGAAAVALLLYAVNHGAIQIWQKHVSSRVVSTLAAYSYAVYLCHWKVFHTVVLFAPHILPHHIRGASAIVVAILTIGISVLLGIAIHEFVEKPFLKLRDANRDSAAIAPVPAFVSESQPTTNTEQQPVVT